MTDVKLPPLPETEYLLGIPARPYEDEWISSSSAYTDEQMAEYARLAVLQERERLVKMLESHSEEHRKCQNWEIQTALLVVADAIRKGE